MLIRSPLTQSINKLMRSKRPSAVAKIAGSDKYPSIRGTVSFWKMGNGTIVVPEIYGLPVTGEAPCESRVFAIHIHEGGRCAGDGNDPFSLSGGHYNPGNCKHPLHAGDLPPLFANMGTAWYAFLTESFDVGEILGKTVIVHHNMDDMMTQPSGNSGEKMACGVIRRALF